MAGEDTKEIKSLVCCKAGLLIKQAVTLLLPEGASGKLQSSCSKTLSRSAQLPLQLSVSMLPVGLLTLGFNVI